MCRGAQHAASTGMSAQGRTPAGGAVSLRRAIMTAMVGSCSTFAAAVGLVVRSCSRLNVPSLHPAVCWTFAATWARCSTANKRCCADPGDACVYKDDNWSRCEPKSGRETGAPLSCHCLYVTALHVPARLLHCSTCTGPMARLAVPLQAALQQSLQPEAASYLAVTAHTSTL